MTDYDTLVDGFRRYRNSSAAERERGNEHPFYDDLPMVKVGAGIARGSYQYSCIEHGHCPGALENNPLKSAAPRFVPANYIRSRKNLEARLLASTGIEARWIRNPRSRSMRMRVWVAPGGQRVRLVLGFVSTRND